MSACNTSFPVEDAMSCAKLPERKISRIGNRPCCQKEEHQQDMEF